MLSCLNQSRRKGVLVYTLYREGEWLDPGLSVTHAQTVAAGGPQSPRAGE